MPKSSLFTPIVEPNRLNPFFELTRTHPTSEPARVMMDLVYQEFKDVDGNFVEQFQTTGFDARVFELYLHAFFSSEGFAINRDHDAPDFILEKDDIRFAVEATTSNPNFQKKTNSIEKILELTREEIDKRGDDEIPIRLGSPLYSKLQRKNKYWELDHCKDIPFLLAIHAFHDETAFLYSDIALAQYLFGLRQFPTWTKDGEVIHNVSKVEEHQFGEKVIPSDFFHQPDAEHISAVIFTNTGALPKFNRIGYQAGFHRGNITLFRIGGVYVPDRGSTNIVPFNYDLDDLDAPEEDWAQGITIIHNPYAKYPIDKGLFPNTGHIYMEEERLFNDYPAFHPQTSITNTLHLQGVPLEFPGTHVISIFKSEFEDFLPEKNLMAELLFEEKQWFATLSRELIGLLVLDRHDEDWGYIVFARESNGSYRQIHISHPFLKARDIATQMIVEIMEHENLSRQIL